jgi:formylglycine-generating enzyme required for sulfatase activity
MGSPESEEGRSGDEGPQHEVEIKPFYLGRYPVTNEEYGRFLAAKPDVPEPEYWGNRKFNQARQPVVGVSWHDAKRFAEWAGGRLPTEAEWEYAARAGTTTRYWWGNEFDGGKANSSESRRGMTPVGEHPPNPWGLHDMLGNVFEWVKDRWHYDYEGAPKDGSAWEEAQGLRVLRGGSWRGNRGYARCAARLGINPDYRGDDVGFRVCCAPPFAP